MIPNSHGIVALVRNGDKFLLLEDAREFMQGLWAPPHGRCDLTDQSEEQSVAREVKEETGLAMTDMKKVHTQAADTKVATVSFWAVQVRDTSIVLNNESSRFGWFTLEEALQLPLYPGTLSFFQKVQAGEIIL